MENSIKKRKRLTIILSIALAATLLIGGTLAYLFVVIDPKTNEIDVSPDIAADLIEPKWEVVKDQAKSMVPSDELDKDPQIVNEDLEDVYVAIKVRYQAEDGSPAVLASPEYQAATKSLKIDGTDLHDKVFKHFLIKDTAADTAPKTFNSNWSSRVISADGFSEIYIYRGTTGNPAAKPGLLKGASTSGGTDGGKTEPLFNLIKIDENAEMEYLKFIHEELGGFNIQVEGFAIQAEGFADVDAAAVELIKLANK